MRVRMVCFAVTLLAALGVRAKAEIVVAAVQGEARSLRGGKWTKLEIGDAIQIGQRVKTASAERAKLLFWDRAVVSIAPNSEMVVDEAEARPNGRHAVALRLLRGRIVAAVSPEVTGTGSYFNVETGTAIATSRGGQLFVHYDAEAQVTEVVGLEGQAEVVSSLAALGGGKVQVPAGGSVRVAKGRLPGAPIVLGVDRALQLAQGVEILGTGRRDGLNVLHPLLTGRLLSPADVPGGTGPEVGPARAVGSWLPGVSLGHALSADVYTNTQPIEVFRALPPGQPSTGDVRVDF